MLGRFRTNGRDLRILSSVIAVMLVASLVLGCAATPTTPTQTSGASTGTQASTTTSAPAAAAPTAAPAPVKPVELRFATTHSTTQNLYVNAWDPFKKEVEKRSGGNLKLTLYPGEALGKFADHWEMVRTGVADMAAPIVPSYTPGKFPLFDIATLPFGYADLRVGTTAIRDLWKKGFLDKEFAENKVLGIAANIPYSIYTTKKPVQKPEDLKGMKIRTSGGLMTPALELLGATPITMATGELYQALQTGVIDGVVLTYQGIMTWKLGDVLKYGTEIGAVGLSTIFLAVNWDTWKKLPKESQAVIDGLEEQLTEWGVKALYDGENEGRDQFVKASGHTVYTVPAAERTAWEKAVQTVQDKWVKDNEAKGIPAGEVLKAYKASVASGKGFQGPK